MSSDNKGFRNLCSIGPVIIALRRRERWKDADGIPNDTKKAVLHQWRERWQNESFRIACRIGSVMVLIRRRERW
jgi:hypothetical protein